MPRTVHFIAKAPVSDVIWLFVSVSNALLRPHTLILQVAVLHQVGHVVHIARTKVYRHNGFCADFVREVQKLIHAHFVRLYRNPGKIDYFGTLLDRTDGLFPIVTRHKVAAGIADYRHAQLRHGLHNVAAEPLFVCRRVRRLVDAVVHRTPQVLHEGTEHRLFDNADLIVFVCLDKKFAHKLLANLPLQRFEPCGTFCAFVLVSTF